LIHGSSVRALTTASDPGRRRSPAVCGIEPLRSLARPVVKYERRKQAPTP